MSAHHSGLAKQTMARLGSGGSAGAGENEAMLYTLIGNQLPHRAASKASKV